MHRYNALIVTGCEQTVTIAIATKAQTHAVPSITLTALK